MKRHQFLFVTLWVLSLAGLTAAQNQHKNQERGFSTTGVYSGGDIDHINLFNGNLAVTIPIGQTYPVNGQLSYAFTLVYNSNSWSPREVCSNAIDLDTHFSSFFSVSSRYVTFSNGGSILISQTNNQTPGGDPYAVAGVQPSESKCWTIQDPNPATNAGLGWQLSFGKLYMPRDDDFDDRPGFTEKSRWVYMSPDGSEHTFYSKLHEDDPDGSSTIWYTRDSSYLRLNTSPPANGYGADMLIEFPNGQKHFFKLMDVRIANPQQFIKGIKEEKLVAMEDQYGNFMRIDYIDKNSDRIADDEWKISDSTGRKHDVMFSSQVAGYQKVISDITLETFGGVQTHYGFTYESTLDVNRPFPHITHLLVPESTDTVKVPLLTAVTLPHGSQYSMPVNRDDLTNAAYDVPGHISTNTGLLQKMILPTGAQIEWKYESEIANDWQPANGGYGYRYGYGAAARHYLRSSAGVRRRIVTINRGTPNPKVYTWKYDPQASENSPAGCQQLSAQSICAPNEFVNKVTTPEGDYTLNYFSIWPYPYGGQGVALSTLNRSKADPHSADYGLPFTKDTRQQSDARRPPRFIANDAWNGYPLFLSQAVFDKGNNLKRSIYVRYEEDVLAMNDGFGQVTDSNARRAATRIVYNDDNGTYAETQYLDFDGLGHYRQENLLGNFGSGDRRLNIVWYNRPNGSYNVETTTNQRTTTYTPFSELAPWLLETYDSKISSDYTTYRSTTYFNFNDKGLMQASRKLRNFEKPNTTYTLTTKDLLVTYDYDGSGNLKSETYYGGDKNAQVSSVDKFTATGESEYAISYSYGCVGTSGSTGTTSVAASSFYTGHETPSLIDNTIDCSTGLVSASRDPAGVQATYLYDELGRMTTLTRQEGAIDKINYLDVQGTVNGAPQVTVKHMSQGPSFTPLGDELYKYDQLGRLFEERKRMPDAGSIYQVRTMAYNGLGWKTADGVWNDGSATSQTKYSNFDPFGRPSTVVAPDGSVTQLGYSGDRRSTRTVKVGTQAVPGSTVTIGQTDATTVETYDRQGRLSQVRESSGLSGGDVTTSYDYNLSNKIVQSKTTALVLNGTQVTQTRTFTYDNLGNLREERLPEVAYRAYDNYDTMGHVGTEYTGKSDLRYRYDFAGRLYALDELSGGVYRPIKDYTYYTGNSPGNNGLGSIKTARRYNWVMNPYDPADRREMAVVVREDYTYGGLDGRLNKTVTRLNAETDYVNHTPNATAYTFEQTFAYDPRGGLSWQTYPQCINTTCAGSPGAARPWRVNYSYKNNWPSNAGGGAGLLATDATRYASSVTYHASGVTKTIVHGNSVEDRFSVDPNWMFRQSRIEVGKAGVNPIWTSGTYGYDGAGNITKIGSDWYTYDKVNRVVEGTALDAGGKNRRYTYDPFGNVTSYATYNGVTATGGNPLLVDNFSTNVQSTTNRVALNYDGAGSAIGLVDQPPLYTYDAVDMVKYAPGYTYLYGPDDERVWSIDTSAGVAADTIWFDDALPGGAIASINSGQDEAWSWTSTNPSPAYGTQSHQSGNIATLHQHYFTGATTGMQVKSGDVLFAYIYIDPVNTPREVMLQWNDGSTDGTAWEHRAFWGTDEIGWGASGTASRYNKGALPLRGQWVRLEIAASAVGLEGKTIKGMAFTLSNGRATWDRTGKRANSIAETVTLRGLDNEVLREYTVRNGDATGHWSWLKDNIYLGRRLLSSETPQGMRQYHLDHLGTPKLITDSAGNPLPGWPYQNFPFGEETSGYAPNDYHVPPTDEKLRFTGQEINSDYSGLSLYYMHARYYYPSNAKFLSVDPAKDVTPTQPQSWNLYAYARNNPVGNTDPTGRSAEQQLSSNQCVPGGVYPNAFEFWSMFNQNQEQFERLIEPLILTQYDAIQSGPLERQIMMFLPAGRITSIAQWGTRETAQILVNQAAGRAAEKIVAEQLVKEGSEVLGSQVAIRTSRGLRFVDHLVRTADGKLVAVEVKSGGAVRTALQKTKDHLIATEGGRIVGKNAPAGMADMVVKIPTVVRQVP